MFDKVFKNLFPTLNKTDSKLTFPIFLFLATIGSAVAGGALNLVGFTSGGKITEIFMVRMGVQTDSMSLTLLFITT